MAWCISNSAYLQEYVRQKSDEEARAKYAREYKYYYGQRAKTEQNSSSFQNKTNQEKEYKHIYSSKREPQFENEDLNHWIRNAREQAESFSKLALNEFSKIVIGLVKETGVQLGNAFLVVIGALLSIGGCGNIVIGLTSKGETGTPILGIILLPLGIFLYSMAQNKYEKHKPN